MLSGLKARFQLKSPEHLIYYEMHFLWLFFSFLLIAVSGIQNHVLGQPNRFISHVLEYKPAPGQFINTSYGNPQSAQSLVDGITGSLCLGGFGGYVVVGFDHAIENHPNNPYGVDFSIFGNASVNSSEPGVVYVMKDANRNKIADDIWYLLAGSDYYFNSTNHGYRITYTNPNTPTASDVPWIDNLGNTGKIEANSFHTQPYYPNKDSFPEIFELNYTLEGIMVQPRIDRTDPAFVKSHDCPFGFADNTPRNLNYKGWEPNNPYTSELEGSGGDGFDISWAVDSDGNPVQLDEIDFIKIQTGVNASAGWLGELSTEILGVVDVDHDASIAGASQQLVLEPLFRNVLVDETIRLNVFHFKWGKPIAENSFSYSISNSELATITNGGIFQALKPGIVKVFATLSENELIADSLEITIESPNNIVEKEKDEFDFFPNPAHEYIQLTENQSVDKIRIINLLGQSWILKEESNSRFNLSNLPSGLFTLYYQTEAGVKVAKLIKK